MCGRKRATIAPWETNESYEGQTTRLVSQRRYGANRFPWWTMWFIWPMVYLVKGASATMYASWLWLAGLMVPATVLLAVGVIAVGVMLLLWQRSNKGL